MQNIRSILGRIWTTVPAAKRELLSGNTLDAMKAHFLGHHFRPAFQAPCYCLQAVCPLLTYIISLWGGGGKERREQRRTGREINNACEAVPCGDACLVTLRGRGRALPEAPTKMPEAGWALQLPALVRYGVHLAPSPWGQSGDGQNAVRAHRPSRSLSQRPRSLTEIQQIGFQLVLRFKA